MNSSEEVQFIFDLQNEVKKIRANKASRSPVFQTMFFGELKEKGDIEIVDASPEAFQEFIAFFHGA